MEKKNKNILPAIIIAVGIIVAALIFAYSNRYEVQSTYIVDKWTGTFTPLEIKR